MSTKPASAGDELAAAVPVDTAQVVERLKDAPLFRGVDPTELAALVQVMRPEHVPAGHVLFRKGDQGDCMYLTLSGQIRIYTQDKNGTEITLALHGPARIFGDFSILDQKPRSASASAVEPTDLLTLCRDDFMKFLPNHAAVGLAMIRNLAEQVRRATTFLSKVNDSLEQLSVGDYDQALQAIAVNSTDSEIQALVNAFIAMMQQLRAREAAAPQPPG